VVEFAYPYGSFTGYLAGQARAMGFESAVSTTRGRGIRRASSGGSTGSGSAVGPHSMTLPASWLGLGPEGFRGYLNYSRAG